MKEVEDFKELVQSVQKKKGRMDAASRAKATQLIATLLHAPEDPVGTVLCLCEELQSDAVADGIGIAWPRLSAERRLDVVRWLPPPRTERAQRRIALLAARLAETDGSTAVQLLDKLIPEHRVSKELRELLIGALFTNGRTARFDRLCDPCAPDTSLRIFKALSDLAFDAASNVEPMARYKLSVAVLNFLVVQKLQQTQLGGDLVSKIVIEVERWPQGLREQFGRWLRTDAPSLSEEFFPLKKSPVVAEAQARPADSSQKGDDPPVTLDQYFERLAQAQATESETLARMRAVFANSRLEMERHLSQSRAREAELIKQLRESDSARITLQEELAHAARRIAELEGGLNEMAHDRQAEHERLSQQIAANASGRVAEFKKQVALTLARQMVDLPKRSAEVDAELGRVLLLQFHQLIEVLEELGIELNAARSVR